MKSASIFDVLSVLLDPRPAWQVLETHERELGHQPLHPGDVPWFSAKRWHPTDLVSLAGNEVRIVAVKARRPRTGAFRRLLQGIYAAGYRPVVIDPLFDVMPELMRRWGWVETQTGETFHDREDQWRPPEGWRP